MNYYSLTESALQILLLKIYKNNGDVMIMADDYDSGYVNLDKPENGHQVSWVQACKAGFGSKEHKALTSSFDYSGPLTETVLMGNLGIRSYALGRPGDRGRLDFYGRRKMLWDGDNIKITNFDDANQFVGRDYREGWKLI